MLRYSLRGMLVFIAFIAVGTASLRYASLLISGSLWLAWLVFLMVTVFGIIYRKGPERAFWLGCCVFGWSFAAYCYFSQGKVTAVDFAIQSAYDAISWTKRVDVQTAQTHSQLGGRALMGGGAPTVTIYLPLELPFKQAASALVGVAITIVGGLIAKWFHATRDREPVKP